MIVYIFFASARPLYEIFTIYQFFTQIYYFRHVFTAHNVGDKFLRPVMNLVFLTIFYGHY